MELESDVQPGIRIGAVRVQVDRWEDEYRPRLEKLAAVWIEKVGISSNFMHGPELAGAARRGLTTLELRGDDRHPHEVVDRKHSTDRLPAGFSGAVVHLFHLDRRDISVFGQAGRRLSNRAPPVRGAGLHRDGRRRNNQVRLADLPL